MKIWIDGSLVDEADAKVSVFDHCLLYGDGVFEGIRAYGGVIFECQAHMDRLYRSAEKLRIQIPLRKSDLCEAIYTLLKANGKSDAYIRLVVTRGRGTLGLDPSRCPGPTVFIIAADIMLYPQEMYDNGMGIIIARTRRFSQAMLDPSIKSCNYLNNILAKLEATEAGVPEAIMLNATGNVAECTGDNIFLVKNGHVVTPDVASGILEGITRGVVVRLCGSLGIPVDERAIRPDELMTADECFLTGTAAEVIAVTTIDRHPIGGGRPGAVTNRLLTAFRDYIREHTANGAACGRHRALID